MFNVNFMEIIFLIGRVLFGGVFLMFGIRHFKDRKNMESYIASKNISSPRLANSLATILLIVSGIFIILGIFSEIAASALILFLIGVSVTMHDFWAIQDPQEKQRQMTSFMLNMALIGANLIIIYINYWPLSL